MLKTALATGLTVLLAACGGGSNNVPQPGQLDTSFNSPLGYVFYEGTVGTTDVGVETAVQPDGRIVVAGYRGDGTKNSALILRYTADGQLDSSFGSKGVVVHDGGGADNKALGLALATDGSIFVTGYIRSANGRDIMVLKYGSDGSLAQQYVYSTPGSATDIGFGITVQKDGKIVVVGEQTNGINQDIVVLRLLSGLTLDPTFGNAGVVAFNGSGNANDKGFAVAVQGDQKIVVAGAEVAASGKNQDLLVLRFDPDGSLDPGFGNKGVFVYSQSGDFPDYGNALRLQRDSKIVVAGASNDGTRFRTLLLRLNANGALDAGFGNGGVVLYQGPGKTYDYAYDLAVQNDDRILVAGISSDGANNDAVVMRFQSNGAIDTSFATSGVYTFAAPSQDSGANAIALQPEGRIVATGYSSYKAENVLLLFRLFE